jgi:putative ABC transport system permease protein
MIIGEWIRRLHYLLRRGAIEEELRREMESHRAQMQEPQSFGNMLRLREEARDAWGWRRLDDVMQDLRFAWRTLRHSPGFTLTAVVTLAFGIGANSAMFSLVNGLLLRPLYARAGEVVSVSNRSTTPGGGARGTSYPNYLDLCEGTATIFEGLAASSMGFLGLDAGDGVKRTLASGITADYFQIFGASPALGRVFTPEEARFGAGMRVAILSHSLWQRRGADPGMIGRSVRINGESFTVVGVAAEGFTGTGIPGPDVWLPLGTQGTFTTEGGRAIEARDAHEFGVVGRLRPGTSIDRVAPALTTVARRLEQAFPAENKGYTFVMSTPSRLVFMPGSGSGVFTAALSVTLMLMPAIVLLVACINLADLLLARGHVRRQELAIRSSLGGGRWRLTRQLLTEGLLLAVIGGAAGLLLSTWATNALLASLRPVIPVSLTLPKVGLDWRVLVGTLGFSLTASLIFGAWPAWALTGRAAVTDLKRHGGEEGRQPGGIRVGNALVIVQVALSLLSLATGGLFLMSALSASTANPGFQLDRGVLVEIDPSLGGYDEARGRQSQLALVDRLRTVPGVETVSIGSSFPFNAITGDSRDVAPAGVSDRRSSAVDAVFTVVGRDYARVLGLPVLAGRDFSDAEMASGSERVAIIDDALAQGLWPGESALGQLIQFLDDEGPQAKLPIRVVGLVPTVRHSLGDPRPFPHVYVPLGHRYESAMTLHVRVARDRDERAMLGPLARAVRDLDDRLPILRVETWRDHVYEGLDVWIYRAGARVFSAFGAIALLLAVIGVYGVKSYVVSRRTREFGIRIATGAHPRALLWQVMREGSRTTIIGIAIGALLALGAGQILQGILYGVDSFEPLVLVTAPLILLAASLLASVVPALRATRVDPTVALRAE